MKVKVGFLVVMLSSIFSGDLRSEFNNGIVLEEVDAYGSGCPDGLAGWDAPEENFPLLLKLGSNFKFNDEGRKKNSALIRSCSMILTFAVAPETKFAINELKIEATAKLAEDAEAQLIVKYRLSHALDSQKKVEVWVRSGDSGRISKNISKNFTRWSRCGETTTILLQINAILHKGTNDDRSEFRLKNVFADYEVPSDSAAIGMKVTSVDCK